MTANFQDASVTAQYISSEVQKAYHISATDKPFVFLLTGPPAAGKSFLRNALFYQWKHLKPCYIPANFALMERQIRHNLLLGERTNKIYDLCLLKDILNRILSFETVEINTYDHESGLISKTAFCLEPSQFIYLENDIWLELLGAFSPDFVVTLVPHDIAVWQNAYIHRNVTFRNYDVLLAKKMFGLLYDEWKTRKEPEIKANLLLQVEYTGENYIPLYSL